MLILRQFQDFSHLNSLSQTCKAFTTLLQPVLYKDFSVVLKQDWISLSCLENLLGSGAGGLQYTTTISVSLKSDDLDVSTKLDCDKDGWLLSDWEDFNGYKQRLDQPRALNSLVWLIFHRIPQNCLQSFQYVTRLLSVNEEGLI